ncbi:MAG: Cof-type HAD-IIB family hydrolase [Clostridiales bacterium]|nr:Cof-type HAD-IIB family hydrolase [Clostridiales bacterium]
MPKKFEGILIASDLDGTLLSNDGTISRRNIDAVRRFMEEGGLFTFATGRNIGPAREFARQLCPNVPAILTNGSVLYDFQADEVRWDCPISEQGKEIMKKTMRQFPTVGTEVTSYGKVYIVRESEYTHKHVTFERIDPTYCGWDALPEKWHKVVYADDPELLQRVAKWCEPRREDEVQYVFSTTFFYEMTPNRVNKGTSLKVLRDILNFKLDKIVAIGDYYNDLDFIRCADIGVFTQNAPEKLKPLADFTVCSNEEGALADLIERIEGGVLNKVQATNNRR